MFSHGERVKLPDSKLGENRCFEFKYGESHGDIKISSWQGSLERKFEIGDPSVKRFSMAHGSDAMFMAALAGYLIRSGEDDTKVSEVMIEAADDILSDPSYANDKYGSRTSLGFVEPIAKGERPAWSDLPEAGWAALIPVIPQQPGPVSEVGGTGMYSYEQHGELGLVIASLYKPRGVTNEQELQVMDAVEFTTSDVPAMARVACATALGEYRKEIYQLVTKLYVNNPTSAKV